MDGDDLVVLAMQDKCRHVDLLEILGEVGLREGPDGLIGVLEAGLHAPQPKLIQDPLGHLGAGPVRAVELARKVPVELRSIVEHAGEQSFEQLERQALGIRVCRRQVWRHRGDQDDLRDTGGSMTTDVARNLAAAGGVADDRDVVKVERLD